MAGDLEDFLKRAAERRVQRQQKTAAGQPTPKKRRPEYTDSRRERQVKEPVQEEIPVAELVEEHSSNIAENTRRKKKARDAANVKRRANAARNRSVSSPAKKTSENRARAGTSTTSVPVSSNAAEELLKLLKQPTGLQQAFLLREILDRPEDRWR